MLLKSLGRTGEASLFLEDWELARVALSCHMALDLLCQEMRDACQDSSESQGLTVFTVFTVFERLFHRGGAVTALERSVVGELEAAAHAGCSFSILLGRLYIC